MQNTVAPAAICDPVLGDPEHNVVNTPFDALPDDWVCPVCGKQMGFREADEEPTKIAVYDSICITLFMTSFDYGSRRTIPQPNRASRRRTCPTRIRRSNKRSPVRRCTTTTTALCGLCRQAQLKLILTPLAAQPLGTSSSADGAIFPAQHRAQAEPRVFEGLPRSRKRLRCVSRQPQFGSFDGLNTNGQTAGLFGSGWVWLAEETGTWQAVRRHARTKSPGNPILRGLKPLLAIDV